MYPWSDVNNYHSAEISFSLLNRASLQLPLAKLEENQGLPQTRVSSSFEDPFLKCFFFKVNYFTQTLHT